jgi:glycosyltransferase involved in cell wall biosynthesis
MERGDITFRFVVHPANYQAARAMLESLSAQEGLDWTLDTPPQPSPLHIESDRALGAEAAAEHLNLGVDRPVQQPALSAVAASAAESPGIPDYPNTNSTVGHLESRHPFLRNIPPAAMAFFLLTACLVSIPLQLMRVVLRPIWRLLWRNGLAAFPLQLRLLGVSLRSPSVAAEQIGCRVMRLPLGLGAVGRHLVEWSRLHSEPTFGATEPSFHVEPEPEPEPEPELELEPGPQPLQLGFDQLENFANANVAVDGWLLLMSNFKRGLLLHGRRVVLFSDAMPLLFPLGFTQREWSADGHLQAWVLDTQRTLADADGVITYSRHVASEHVERFFGPISGEISVIKHAVPDLRRDLPFVATDRRRTGLSRRLAADLLRRHSAERGWNYLASFPFEDVSFVAVSTQDRPTKNYGLVVEALRRLIRRDYRNVKLIVTARIDAAVAGSQLSNSVRETRMEWDVVSMTNLPRTEHAALYHCAGITVHPSLIEGGDIAFPWPESVSLGTPCIVARGPHIDELLQAFPAFEPWVFDPYDVDGLARLILDTIENREDVLARQIAIFDLMRRRTWADVAGEYAEAVTGSPLSACSVEAQK